MRFLGISKLLIFILIGGLLCLFLAFSLLFLAAKVVPFPKELLSSVSFSTVVADCKGNILRVFPNERGDYILPVSLERVSPYVIQATCAIEDRRFWSHFGVDLFAIVRAIYQNITSGRIVSGASTITQQVVRLLDPSPRTIWSKLKETFRAIQLESSLSKREILSLYLTLAPYGGNIYGIEAAALVYFGKRAAELDLPEAALLAGLPQAPSALRPDRFPERALKRRNLVLEAMVKCGYAKARQVAPYKYEGGKPPIRFRRHPFPFRAPHFCRLLKHLSSKSFWVSGTLELSLQDRIEKLLQKKAASLSGVRNAACIVIENRTGAVRAYVGSIDLLDRAHGGQIDGALAFRCPGSTLKPFLYAKLFDNGLLSPEEILPDLPLLWSSWRPENFDQRFHGLVQALEALSKSYNLTAVRLLRRYGLKRFVCFLSEAGLERGVLEKTGLSLILGSVSVRLVDLARVYCALARFGKPVPLLLTTGQTAHCDLERLFPQLRKTDGTVVALGEEESRLFSFSPESCFLVAEALTRSPKALHRPIGYAWKTGTSWCRRDSWTVAYTPKYTVGVWFGNFSGEPARALVGAEVAAPCALEILSWLDPSPEWPEMPEGIEYAALCAKTGLRAGRYCPEVVQGRVLRKDRRHCSIHIRFPLERNTGEFLCRACLPHKDFVWKVFEVWPPDVEAYLEANGKKPLPKHFSACNVVHCRNRLRFVIPQNGGRYVLKDGLLPVEVLTLSKKLSFFLDGKYIGTKPRIFSLRLSGCTHTLCCINEEGEVAAVKFDSLEEEKIR